MSRFKYDVYLAGPFFNDKQKATMHAAKEMLQSHGLIVCDPQDLSPVLVDLPPEERKKHVKDIFTNNIDAMNRSFALLACIDDRDTGTSFELGYCFASFKEKGPILTFSSQGFGANVMLSEATNAHFETLGDLDVGLRIIGNYLVWSSGARSSYFYSQLFAGYKTIGSKAVAVE
jgi:nucleoside 2-deoxyribosyltransferase